MQQAVALPVMEAAKALAAVQLFAEVLVAEALVALVLVPVVAAAVLPELLAEVGVALFSSSASIHDVKHLLVAVLPELFFV